MQAIKPGSASAPLAREVEVINQYGIHARPAALLVKTASNFNADIRIEKDDVSVSAKSIMGLLTLEGSPGTRLRLVAEGPEAEEALAALADLFAQKFFED